MKQITIEHLESRTSLLASPALVDAALHLEALEAPAAPTLSIGAVSQMQVNLSWNAVPGAGYAIERSDAGSPFRLVASVPEGVTSWSNTGLASKTTYSYRVRAGGYTSYSTPAAATTLAYDAGLNSPLLLPANSTGTVRNILSYGATSNNSSNDDATAIKNAINAAVSGDVVYIPNGTFHIKARDIQLKTGVSIHGQSTTGAVLLARFTDQGTSNPNSQLFEAEPGVNNLTLQNFRIAMDTTGQSMQYGLYLGSGSTGVSNVSRIRITNLNIEGFEKFAIAIRNGDNIKVEGCLIRNASALGGGGEGYCVMIGYDNSRNNWITGNTFGPTIRHAVVIQYRAHHNLIEENVTDGSTLDAYDLHGEDEYSNEIRYNVARNTGGFGIGIGNTGSTHDDAGPNNWVHHNKVYNSRGGASVILGSDNQIIEDNYFHHNTNEGILVYNGGGSGLRILRNTMTFNETGASIDDATNLWMEGNVITNNIRNGLRVGVTTTTYTIRSNDFRFNGAPIQLDSTDGIFLDNLL